MTRTAVAHALQRGVALALSLANPLLAGCGGETATGACGAASSQPMGGFCSQQLFAFHGTPATCDADNFGALSPSQCESLCPTSSGSAANLCSVDWGASPELITCDYAVPVGPGCGIGRRPAGLRSPPRSATQTPAGRLFAEIAHLEAASVHAFIVLARELEGHGAPAHLRAASLRAARDEIRHAAVMREFAEGAGARVAAVRVERQRRRTLEAMAVDNAVEGCVGETYGAAVAYVQADRASDPRVRAAMKHIAADETRHPEFSFELARWFDENLSVEGRRRVRDARTRAVHALARSVRRAPHGTTAVTLGLPTADQAAALIDELRWSLWT